MCKNSLPAELYSHHNIIICKMLCFCCQ